MHVRKVTLPLPRARTQTKTHLLLFPTTSAAAIRIRPTYARHIRSTENNEEYRRRNATLL